MRQVCVCAAYTILLPFLAFPAERSVTVLLEFEQPHSLQSVDEMERETQTILKDSGMKLDWRLKSEVPPNASFEDVVVVKMRGRCEINSRYPLALQDRGPLAFTYTSDGEVLPFSEVQCDKVRQSIRGAMGGSDFHHGELLLGRALGRVLAHEMYHIFAATGKHGSDGVAKTSLSGSQLIGDELRLSDSETQAIARERGR